MTELHWTEIDQVPAIWANVPGPFRACLLFRTGRVDETLTSAGITHLIEHLAISSVNDGALPHNGFVNGPMTGFITMGQPQTVVDFLTAICNFLSTLKSDRLENEKQVLAAESAGRPYDFRSNLLTKRYGAAGYGLLGLPELGLRKANLEQLREYSAQKFTRENAVLWLSGPPPAGLRFNLPSGSKQPVPGLAPTHNTVPGWFVEDASGGIASGSIVPRVSAASLFAEIANRRLRERLRVDKSLSYSPAVLYEPISADIAHLILFADSQPENRAELSAIFGEIVESLDKIDESDVEIARQQTIDHWIGSLAPPPADRMMIDLQRAAIDWLFGKEFETMETLAANLSSTTVEDVSKFSRSVQETAIFALPTGVSIKPFGKRILPSRVPVIQGEKVFHLDSPIVVEHIQYGADGVSVIWPDSTHVTVRYAELSAVLSYDDGCVCLIGSDASILNIEPTLWHNGQNVCRKIREKVPAQLILEQPPRPASSLPKPGTTAWQRFRARLSKP